MVVWLRPNIVTVSINELTPGQVGLVLARVTFFTGSSHVNTVLLFNQPSRSTQPGHPSVGRWVVIRHAVYLNVDSPRIPLSVASQCKLVLRAIEMEISASLWAHVSRE